MPIARLIFVTVGQDQMEQAERVWKQDCAPLMIKSPGCLSEELLKCTDSPGEYISYSEWEDQASIDRYLESDEHEQIRQHTRGLMSGSRPLVKRYEVVG